MLTKFKFFFFKFSCYMNKTNCTQSFMDMLLSIITLIIKVEFMVHIFTPKYSNQRSASFKNALTNALSLLWQLLASNKLSVGTNTPSHLFVSFYFQFIFHLEKSYRSLTFAHGLYIRNKKKYIPQIKKVYSYIEITLTANKQT